MGSAYTIALQVISTSVGQGLVLILRSKLYERVTTHGTKAAGAQVEFPLGLNLLRCDQPNSSGMLPLSLVEKPSASC